jgi:hypothetical protein
MRLMLAARQMSPMVVLRIPNLKKSVSAALTILDAWSGLAAVGDFVSLFMSLQKM